MKINTVNLFGIQLAIAKEREGLYSLNVEIAGREFCIEFRYRNLKELSNG